MKKVKLSGRYLWVHWLRWRWGSNVCRPLSHSYKLSLNGISSVHLLGRSGSGKRPLSASGFESLTSQTKSWTEGGTQKGKTETRDWTLKTPCPLRLKERSEPDRRGTRAPVEEQLEQRGRPLFYCLCVVYGNDDLKLGLRVTVTVPVCVTSESTVVCKVVSFLRSSLLIKFTFRWFRVVCL